MCCVLYVACRVSCVVFVRMYKETDTYTYVCIDISTHSSRAMLRCPWEHMRNQALVVHCTDHVLTVATANMIRGLPQWHCGATGLA